MPPIQTAEPVTTTASTGCCGPSCGCGPQAPVDAEPGATREVIVDFLYLDLNTCQRCVATGDTLDEALAVLDPVLSRIGVSVAVNKVNITTAELAGQYRFVSSPTIRVDGVDISAEIAESHCADCSDLSGCATDCRVFVFQGREYEQPPAAMIIDGVLRALYAPPTPGEPEPYVMPPNLADYFHGTTAGLLRYARLEVDEPTSAPVSSGCGCGSGCGC